MPLILYSSSSTPSSALATLSFGPTWGEGPMSPRYWRVYSAVNIKNKPHKLYSNIPYMTCKVHIYPVFLLCWPVNQVNYNKSTGSTGQQWMGKLNKSSTAISHTLLVKCTFILCSYFFNQSTRSTTISRLAQLVNNEWVNWTKFYCNIPYITCKVHIYPVFLLCRPVNQVDYNKSTGSTGQQWMGKLNKSFYCNIPYITCKVHIYPVFLLCSTSQPGRLQ